LILTARKTIGAVTSVVVIPFYFRLINGNGLGAFGRSFFKGQTLSQSTSAPINVVAVSLATRQAPVMLTGTLTTNALHVIALTPLPGSIVKIRERL